MRPSLALIITALFAAPAFAETIRVEFTEVPYQRPYAFLGLHFEGLGTTSLTHRTSPSHNGKPLGFGLRMQSAHDSNFQLELGMGLGRLDASALNLADKDAFETFELTIGGRIHPRKPLVALGSLVLRPTLGMAAGGATVGGGANLIAILSAGLIFGFTDDPNGLTVEFVYRPLPGEAKYRPSTAEANEEVVKFGSTWGIRLGFLFGPR